MLKTTQIESFIPEVTPGVEEILGRKVDFSGITVFHYGELAYEIARGTQQAKIDYEKRKKHTLMATDTHNKGIYVFPLGFSLDEPSAKMTLAHELTHIADEQLFENLKIRVYFSLGNFKHGVAGLFEKVLEGHAEYVRKEWGRIHVGDQKLTRPLGMPRLTGEELERQKAKYTDGVALVARLYEENIPISIAFDNLPSEEEFADPDLYLDRVRRLG